MPDKPDPKAPAPLEREELGEFLLWFFTHTGHAAHVETWRRSLPPPPKQQRDA